MARRKETRRKAARISKKDEGWRGQPASSIWEARERMEAFRGEVRQKTSGCLCREKIKTVFAAEVTKTQLTAGLLRAISASVTSKNLSNPVP
jgi:hypothetical protein